MNRNKDNHTVSFFQLTNRVWQLILPYRGLGLLIIVSMIVETAMSLALPWPLKIIIDHVIGSKPLPDQFCTVSLLINTA